MATVRFWVLALVAVGFAVIFFARVPVDQPYFLRYAFSWWPPFAFAAGAVLSAAIHPGAQRAVAWVGVAALAAVLVATMSALRTDLTTTTRADWRAASETITVSTRDDTTVIFDDVRPFGAYRTPFAGRPRYVDGERLIPLALHLVPRPEWVDPGGPIRVMLLGARPDVDGWTRTITGGFAFYEPTYPLYGKEGAVVALFEFADVLGPDQGASMILAAASLYADGGDVVHACELLISQRDQAGDSLRGRIDVYLDAVAADAVWIAECTAHS